MRMSMVSAASGSFHSSSGGTVDDDELDSRAPPDTISSFLYNFPPPQTSHSMFDPFSTLDNTRTLTHRNPSPATNCTADKPSTVPGSSLSPSSTQPPASPRATKKRTRTSRRVPTTVLTTDTSNFRTMVQEFTGIPMPPFVSSSRPRLNLLQTADSASPTSYLLRPFAQKLKHTVPSTSPSSLFSGNSTNALLSSSSLQIPNLSNSQSKAVNLHSLYQHQQQGVTTSPKSNPAMLQWSSGYGDGGELGSFVAGGSGNSDSIGSCDPYPETKRAEDFLAEAERRGY